MKTWFDISLLFLYIAVLLSISTSQNRQDENDEKKQTEPIFWLGASRPE